MAEDIPFIAPEIEETLVTIEEEAVSESLPAEKAEEAQSAPAALPLEREETQSAPAELPEPTRRPGRQAGRRNTQPVEPPANRWCEYEAEEEAAR